MAMRDEIEKGRKELENKIQENIIQSNEIARLNVKICDLVKTNKRYEGHVKGLEKGALKWQEGKAELDSLVQSLNAAKKKTDAEKVSRALELSSTKVELELAKRQVLLLIISEKHIRKSADNVCCFLPPFHEQLPLATM